VVEHVGTESVASAELR